MMLLDTHALVWAMSEPKKLGAKARRLIESAASAGTLAMSVSSWLELELLIERRGVLSRDVLARLRRTATEFDIAYLAVDSKVIDCASAFVRAHGDPFDLIIAATASVHNMALATADERLLSWPDKHAKRVDIRR
jgi:PIN domain nuclease of toxin-antitoxin system